MSNEGKVIAFVRSKNKATSPQIAGLLGVSRQYAHTLLSKLAKKGQIVRIGSTIRTFYVLPQYAKEHPELLPSSVKKVLINKKLEEHKILEDVENRLPVILKLPENIRSLFSYAFSEMLNNAIEHSKSQKINITVSVKGRQLMFDINDFGIGVFKNVRQKKKLRTQIEAAQELLKGKVTTQPHAHSGEGIFFTSKSADIFILDSYGLRLVVDNVKNDIHLGKPRKVKRGTLVRFILSTRSARHLDNVFKKFTDASSNQGEGFGFNKTEIKVRLYAMGGVHISRSQARRISANLNKFESVVLDYEKVPSVGQAFADEIYRVFQNKYPDIKITTINANEAVRFMIERVTGKNPRGQSSLFDYIGRNKRVKQPKRDMADYT